MTLTQAVRNCTERYNRRMSTMSATEARAALPEILDRVLAGEEVTITRHGQPIAVVVRPDALKIRRADRALGDAERVRQLLEQGRATSLTDAPTLTEKQARDLAADVARSRSAR